MGYSCAGIQGENVRDKSSINIDTSHFKISVERALTFGRFCESACEQTNGVNVLNSGWVPYVEISCCVLINIFPPTWVSDSGVPGRATRVRQGLDMWVNV